MRFDFLDDWLAWQQSLNSNSIELGLERVSAVANCLQLYEIAEQVIIVAGTNGKGSTVACYETWLNNAGFSVGSYTSPHLLRYNERIKVNRQLASDKEICEAFSTVDQARGDILLTYFEFGTLAALWLIQRSRPDFAILEVGLGGRLDAVNIIDANLVHLTSIGVDHQGWLGCDRETIGFEKAGVLREGIPVICNDIDLPVTVQKEITRLDCRPQQYQREFIMQVADNDNAGEYRWQAGELRFDLTPVLPGKHQVQNLAGVVAGLHQLIDLTNYKSDTVQHYFEGISLPGRFQQIELDLEATVYVDVGHNEDAARALAENLTLLKKPEGRVVVLLGMLDDKDNPAFVRELSQVVDEWWLVSLDSDRGLSASVLGDRVESEIIPRYMFETIDEALNEALSSLGNQDIMLVTGSFLTVEQCLLALSIKH
ncbi:MAG: bifunctional folylpolyglutamate synthase/dihydrofolate synthase [Gammaproteobacteria bacterium]|nr:bifunctional folylpolyglutamate synthase/dihydrofolate synthase [Gammaproteobacteria bacterium]